MSHHRRTVRHACRLAVRLVDGGRPQPAVTFDISDHGLFVRTDEHWVPNALVRFHVADPDDPRPLALLGIVARCLPLGAHHPEGPGIGISLFGNVRPAETRWRGIVRQAAAAAAGWRVALEAPRDAIDAIRRRHTRRHALVQVELETDGRRGVADLGDLSEGGVFLRPETSIEPETSARLHLVARSGESVNVHALVVRVAEEGIGLKITPLSAAENEQWIGFLAQHAPVRRTLPAFLPSFNPEERP